MVVHLQKQLNQDWPTIKSAKKIPKIDEPTPATITPITTNPETNHH
jgi:hypothetical protein